MLTVADKEGGAHVDPSRDPTYVDLVDQNATGWMSVRPDGTRAPIGGDVPYAIVRQVAWELEQTLTDEMPDLVGV